MPRGYKKVDPEEIEKLIDEFNEIIVPWCKENKLGYTSARAQATEDAEKDRIFKNLMKTQIGKIYVSETFRDNKQFGEKYIGKNRKINSTRYKTKASPTDQVQEND